MLITKGLRFAWNLENYKTKITYAQNTKSEIDKNIRGKIIKELKDYNYIET